MKTTKATKRKSVRRRKANKAKTGAKAAAPRREPNLVATVAPDDPARCPRCGETEAIVLRATRTSGLRLYLCMSEACKASGLRPRRGRGFLLRRAGNLRRTE
jgi:hypothetical protein